MGGSLGVALQTAPNEYLHNRDVLLAPPLSLLQSMVAEGTKCSLSNNHGSGQEPSI